MDAANARFARLFAAVVALPLGALGCGPSFQAVYESDVQFEHCYGLDVGGTASSDAKRICWGAWVASYTYGQSRDRVDYATNRLSQLSADLAIGSAAAPITSSAPASGSPLPKDAFVPPPNVSDSHADGPSSVDGGAANGKSAHEIAARAPAADCTEACSQRWSTCYGTCRDGACGVCDRAYRSCMPPCFHDDAASPAPSARYRP